MTKLERALVAPPQKKCQQCQTMHAAQEVAVVRGKWMCRTCGQIEIATWNNMVRQSES